MARLFDINREGRSVRCLLYCDRPGELRQAVVCGHGFGGHKDNRAFERFARFVLSKRRDTAVICFDWPCHGADARKKLLLSDCDEYLRLVTDYARGELGAETLFGYATSFGAYLFLKYIAEHPNPFSAVALRCPAVKMHEALTGAVMTPEELEKIEKGREVLVGFDRKVKIGRDFLESLKAADISTHDFLEESEGLMILHGTKDEIIPIGPVAAFADDNLIPFLPIENADHRFTDPGRMDLAINEIYRFFWP